MTHASALFRTLCQTVTLVAAVAVLGEARCLAATAQDAVSDAKVDDAQIVAAINKSLSASWRDSGVTPSKPAPDGAWARRVYLDLVGRIPTIDELEAFVAQAAKSRRRWLVDRLLGDSYRDEHARWRATEWANLLIGRTGGGRNSLAVREPFEKYLRVAFAENRPLDQLMREMVTASGSVRPEDDDHNPAANYLADKMDENGVQATAKTAQLFLGVSVQCTQCHNHPFNEGRQNQFWELAAFFRQTRAERVRDDEDDRPKARIVDRDFYGEGRDRMAALASLPGQADAAETYYELRNGKLKVAYPVFIDGNSLHDVFLERGHDYGDSGRLALVNRREELAGFIAESPDFARSAVNREWGRFFGYGFTRPVDDMGAHNPPSHPDLMATLATAFRDADYDLLRLSRWIVLSDAYGLDSMAGRSNQDDEPSLGQPPLFTRFYLRQLSAEQIYESLITATRADEALSDDRRDEARRRWTRQFATAFGNDENGEATSFNGSIPQSLAMMNSELVRRATELGWVEMKKKSAAAGDYAEKKPAGFLSSIAADRSLSNADRVEKLYLAALARKPDRKELAVCNQLLVARKGNAAEALRDVWWALLNSNEFILQH
ncbi:hypothetical protein Pla108_11210 [Botrimarina colliarenosi]|uniref:DUF1549 domain-containing protein n=1 Tax=Botrimarina colliarenosi TaxID=2528001 RepID=A0A5C6AM25_9BACT|nr:DUF1549 domain-containing protein [Botrimarina colliarenosi]TWU00176.1 hypothetical protein Pla108_11210 [Botrimarina colliarenosi]